MNKHTGSKFVLHAGCGMPSPNKLHPIFRGQDWHEIRMDIDPAVKPDVIADMTSLSRFGDCSVDAVWSSHNLEHLHDHEVPRCLGEFYRVLKNNGFVLVTLPDLEAVAQLVLEGRLEAVAYQSPAGPITALDMLFGYRRSIEAGNRYMMHKTGFTQARLERVLRVAGFDRVFIRADKHMALWALGLMPDAPLEIVPLVFRQQASPS